MRYHFPPIAARLLAAIASAGAFGVTLFFSAECLPNRISAATRARFDEQH